MLEMAGGFINFVGIDKEDTANCMARIRVYQRCDKVYLGGLPASAG